MPRLATWSWQKWIWILLYLWLGSFGWLQGQTSFQQICPGEPFRFDTHFKSVSGRIIEWKWNFDDPTSGERNTSTAQSPQHSFVNPGEYHVQLIIKLAIGISDTLITPVKVRNPQQLVVDGLSACTDSCWKLEVVDEKSEWQSIHWAWGDGTAPDSGLMAMHRFAKEGVYQLKVVGIDPQGCVDSLEYSLNSNPQPTPPRVANDTICAGETITLPKPAGADSIRWYLQTPEKTFTLSEADEAISPPIPFGARLEVSHYASLSGCESPRVTVPLTILAKPEAHIQQYHQTPDRLPARIRLSVASATSFYRYRWNFGDGTTSSDSVPVHYYSKAGEYQIGVEAVTRSGTCRISLEDSITISVPSIVTFPSAFSPNGDGFNDYFSLEMVNLKDLDVSVFDRGGTLVFHARGADFRWDGQSREGRAVAEGVYVLLIRGRDETGKLFERRETLTIIR